MTTAVPFGRPLYVMLKPAGPMCNLACHYCYYLEKRELYPTDKHPTMSKELLEEFTRQYIEAQTMPQVLFTWHGGETLLRSVDFYQHALKLQRRYARGRQIDNCLQTNGTLLTDEWCKFFKENNFLIGISIDGPQEYHDHYRKTHNGRPTWNEVMRGIHLLQKHGVEWNAMAVVNSYNADHPLEFYRFFKEIGCQYLQFTPVVEQIEGEVTDFSVTPNQWGTFLCELYDEWVKQDVGEIFVQTFDATLANWVGEVPGVCSLSAMCGHAAAMEFNGDVYSCDHFVFPEFRLGNIRQQSLTSLMYGERQKAFSRMKHDALPRQCRECRYLFACHGECPKNRFATDSYGNPGLNYLCQGYHRFFEHVAADMDFMKAQLDAGKAPSNIMKIKNNS